MKKLYFICNDLRSVSRVSEALKSYYIDKTGNRLCCAAVLVNVDKKDFKWEIDYFRSNFDIKECRNMREVELCVNKIDKYDTMVLISLYLTSTELGKDNDKDGYKFVSMRIMDELRSRGIEYAWYNWGFEKFIGRWKDRYREIYGADSPKIYSRDNLILVSFSEVEAREILGV